MVADIATFDRWKEQSRRDDWHNTFVGSDIREMLGEIERLREALKPFVIAANDADGYPDNHRIGCDPCMPLEGLIVGDLRRARAAHQN